MNDALTPDITIADGVTHPLDPRWIPWQRRVALLDSAWFAFLLLIGAAAGVVFGKVAVKPVAAVTIVLALANLAFNLWWPAIAYRYASYKLEGRTLEIRRGVLFRSWIDVPRSRIQHSDVSQGPLERRFGLGTLTVFTAGTAHAKVELHGLEHARALAIRDYLMRSDEDDVV